MTTEGAPRPMSPKARRALGLAVASNVLIVAIGLVAVVTEEALIVRLLGALFALVAAVSAWYFVRRLRGRGRPRRFENDPVLRMTLGNSVLRLAMMLVLLVLVLVP